MIVYYLDTTYIGAFNQNQLAPTVLITRAEICRTIVQHNIHDPCLGGLSALVQPSVTQQNSRQQ